MTFKRQTGGSGQYAAINVNFEPNPGKGFEFEDKVVSGTIPTKFIPFVKKGFESKLKEGYFGYPILDVKITLLGGKFHEVDSKDISFEIVARMCLSENLPNLGVILMEPTMEMELVTPYKFKNSVISYVNKKRAKIIHEKDQEENFVEKTEDSSEYLNVLIPLSEVIGDFSTGLRSISQGRANYSMNFSCYSDVPLYISEKIVKKGSD